MKRVLLFSLCLAFAVAAIAAAADVYVCRKCQTVLRSETRPRLGTCTDRHGHHWESLGPVGRESWQCEKCRLLIRAKGRPRLGTCPAGAGHKWSRL